MFGRRSRLREATIALKYDAGKPTLTRLPQGSEVLVIDHVAVTSTDPPNRHSKVQCNGGVFSIFLVDIRERGELIHLPASPSKR